MNLQALKAREIIRLFVAVWNEMKRSRLSQKKIRITSNASRDEPYESLTSVSNDTLEQEDEVVLKKPLEESQSSSNLVSAMAEEVKIDEDDKAEVDFVNESQNMGELDNENADNFCKKHKFSAFSAMQVKDFGRRFGLIRDSTTAFQSDSQTLK
jgi:hypothetical protein